MTAASQARTYCEAGWYLVPIPAGSKAPDGLGWQQPDRAISDPDEAERFWTQNPTFNMGLLHNASGTCTIDIDDVECTKIIFETMGIDYNAVMSSSARIVGHPDRAKALFSLPPGVDLKTHKISWPDKDDPRKRNVVFELRAGAVQDVIPPSIHPETGESYKWSGRSFKSGLALPPDQILTIWQDWDRFRPQMMDACPWAPKKQPQPEPRKRTESQSSISVIDAFNDAHDMHELLVRFGYKPTRNKRYLSPNSSSGIAGVVLFDNGKAYSHHASDPFDSAHSFDAFDLWCHYEHLGDVSRAVRAAAIALDVQSNPVISATPEDIARQRHGAEVFASWGKTPGKDKAEAVADIPDTLLTVPGVLGHAVNYYNATSPMPQPQFAVQAALAFGSTVLGRRFVTDQRNFTSLYFICIAGTATGKEHIKACIDNLLEASGLERMIGPQGYTSASGVISALMRQPTHIAVVDEFGRFMEAVKSGGTSHKMESITAIMEAFGRLDGTMRPLGYSTMNLSAADAADRAKTFIKRPALTFIGITTPSTFYESMSSRYVLDGLLNRFIIVESLVPRQLPQRARVISPSEQLIKWAKEMSTRTGGEGNLSDIDSHDFPPVPVEVPFSEGAIEKLQSLGQLILDRMNVLEKDGLEAMYGRTREQAMRLALIVAMSKGESQVSRESAIWAIEYVMFYAAQAIPALKSNMHENDLDHSVKAAVRCVRKAGSMGLTERELSRASSSFRSLGPNMRKAVLDIMKTDHGISFHQIDTGKPGRARVALCRAIDD